MFILYSQGALGSYFNNWGYYWDSNTLSSYGQKSIPLSIPNHVFTCIVRSDLCVYLYIQKVENFTSHCCFR